MAHMFLLIPKNLIYGTDENKFNTEYVSHNYSTHL